jgi:hypothetical protein
MSVAPTGNSTPTVQQDGAQIVVLGSFTPAIFSPAWLSAQRVIGDDEVADAEVQVIMPRLAAFRVGWLQCQVQDDRMSLATVDPQEFGTLRDAASAILTILSHTPISMMGLNRDIHVSIPDADSWHRIGDVLAPKEPWESSLQLPGMRDVSVQGVREDDFAGSVNVSVQPSTLVIPGVYVNWNDHYVLRHVDSQPKNRNEFFDPQHGAARRLLPPDESYIPFALEILRDKWSDSMKRAQSIFDMVLRIGRLAP